jgi:tRNA wybutosine-synthesizing protein 5
MNGSHDIERLPMKDLSDDSFIKRYVQTNRPVLITDGADGWPARRRWSSPYLRHVVGGKRISIKYNDSGVFDYNKHGPDERVNSLEVSMDRAISLIYSAKAPRHYIQQASIGKSFPELASDIVVPSLITSRHKQHMENIWFGAKCCKTPLHYDIADNLFSQIVGRKRVLLFPPEESGHLYPAVGATLAHCSRINVFDPDLQEFPLFQRALSMATDMVLEPGNMLYIPSRWWHAIESLDVSISVNIWWSGAAG